MKKAYILIGASGSGKSTFTNQLREQFGDIDVFSLDFCRVILYKMNNNFSGMGENQIYTAAFDFANANVKLFESTVNEFWRSALKDGEVVVVDNTNSSRKSRQRWVQDLKKAGFHITAVEFMTTIQTVVDRQSTRTDKSVPGFIVKQQYMRQEAALKGSECDEVLVVRN